MSPQGDSPPSSVPWSASPSAPRCSHRAVTAPVAQERDWEGGGRSPEGPWCPHGAQEILTAPCTHGDTCNTEPASGLQAPCPQNQLPTPQAPGRSSTAQRLQEYVFLFLQEKVAFGLRDVDFGYLSPLSTPSLKFSRISSKAFEKLQFPQTSYFSDLKKSSTLVAKGKYIKISVCT